jgi:hypothetical protein
VRLRPHGEPSGEISIRSEHALHDSPAKVRQLRRLNRPVQVERLDVALPGGRPARRAGPGKVGRQEAEHVLPRVLRGVLERGEEGDEAEAVDGLHPGLENARFFFFKPSPVFFWGFCGFFFFYLCAQKRGVFRVFSVSRILLGASRL